MSRKKEREREEKCSLVASKFKFIKVFLEAEKKYINVIIILSPTQAAACSNGISGGEGSSVRKNNNIKSKKKESGRERGGGRVGGTAGGRLSFLPSPSSYLQEAPAALDTTTLKKVCNHRVQSMRSLTTDRIGPPPSTSQVPRCLFVRSLHIHKYY